MKSHPKLLIIPILVTLLLGCQPPDKTPPAPEALFTSAYQTADALRALRQESTQVPETLIATVAGFEPTVAALPSAPQATEKPTSEPESETESYTVVFEGISVLFERSTREDLDRFFLQISSNGQLAYESWAVPQSWQGWFLSGPLSIANPPQFYNLDEDPEVEIVLEILEDGTQCCAHTIIANYAPEDTHPFFQYEFTWHIWEPSRNFPSFLDLDQDGKLELVSQNEGFSPTFGSFETSEAAPIQIWHYSPDGLRDVTIDFPESIRQDADRWWGAYANEESDLFGHPAALSAYVTDQCMLEDQTGGKAIDWDRAERIYHDSAQGVEKPWEDYLLQLLGALDANGYSCQIDIPSMSVPVVSPTPTRLPLAAITFEPVNFSYDPALLSEIISESIPASPDAPEAFRLPDHVYITMDVNTPCDRSAWIYSIPVEEYIQINPGVEATLTDLRNLLELKPTALPYDKKIPHLPHPNAAQVMQASISYLEFQNGSGVRSLLIYTQNLIRADVCNFQYIYQGLTHDGRYFISATIPIFIPVLEENSVKGKIFFNHQEIYIRYIEALVSAQSLENFSPDLSFLDAMMRSLLVE